MGQYNYTKTINSDKLLLEIEATLSITLNGTDGNIIVEDGDNVTINTVVDLSAEDKTTLDGIVSAHTTAFPEADFSPELFLDRLGDTFNSIERLNLSKAAPSFVVELQYHNFAEIKVIRDYLVTNTDITQAQADSITSLFAEQSINLDNY
jgi:hypothetical protein